MVMRSLVKRFPEFTFGRELPDVYVDTSCIDKRFPEELNVRLFGVLIFIVFHRNIYVLFYNSHAIFRNVDSCINVIN